MATVNALSTPQPEPVVEEEASEAAPDDALVPAELTPEDGRLRLSPAVARLPVELDVGIPVRGFRVRELINLAVGAVISSQWVNGDDLPLQAGKVQLAWAEFEVVDAQLAVRITRLS